MSVNLAITHIVLAIVAFLISLNGFLRGSKKAQIDASLSLVLVVTLGVILWRFGLLAAIVGFFMSFAYVALTKPIASRISGRLLGYRTAYESRDSRPTYSSVEDLLRGSDNTEERLQRIANTPAVARLLTEQGLTKADFVEQFWFLQRSGLGNLAWDVVSSPDELRTLLELRASGLSPDEIALRMIR